MADPQKIRIGKQGTLALPDDLQRAYGLHEDALVTVERRREGILLRPTSASAEVYSPEEKAAFLLSNAVDEEDYRQARQAVYAMGLDPDAIDHVAPEDANRT